MQDPISREKIQTLLSDESVRRTVSETLKAQKLSSLHPTLKAQLALTPTPGFILHHTEVEKVFSYFGELLDTKATGNTFLITFKDPVSAFFAQKVFNNKEIPELNITFTVDWYVEERRRVPFADIQNTSTSKLTARFDVLIENDDEFQVARRIIGPKGINMKTIVEKCCKGLKGAAHDIIKLRLRGRGSGFKEGPEKQESTDRLHICISSKYTERLQMASKEVEKLLNSVYEEYDQFKRPKGLTPAFNKS